jgi:hypothetical protein
VAALVNEAVGGMCLLSRAAGGRGVGLLGSAKALAWAMSGSRGSAGKTSSQARSRRIPGLSMRIRFTVISSPVAMSEAL